ncbi:MAG TPA: class I SAM-dependent methyltransferase [Verrucomicrobiae bacterium]|nr:class I SAM-dependent methyltransferase [Verrucomicrobiae bacterium]
MRQSGNRSDGSQFAQGGVTDTRNLSRHDGVLCYCLRTMSSELNPIQRAASEQFTRQSHRYGKGHILENIADVQAALEKISLPAGAAVLDAATGGGHTGLHLASLGYRVTLSDLTEAMLQRAGEAATARGLNVALRCHPAEAMPYPDASFDLVTCRVAPHHFSSVAGFVAEVARVLKPRGFFLLIDGTVQDDEPEAEAWLHQVEKLRDPSHHRFLTPRQWGELCRAVGLTVTVSELHLKKQPDLNWYFETAATPVENRQRVVELVAHAPAAVRKLFALGEEEGRTIWWWPMLTLVAQKSGH